MTYAGRDIQKIVWPIARRCQSPGPSLRTVTTKSIQTLAKCPLMEEEGRRWYKWSLSSASGLTFWTSPHKVSIRDTFLPSPTLGFSGLMYQTSWERILLKMWSFGVLSLSQLIGKGLWIEAHPGLRYMSQGSEKAWIFLVLAAGSIILRNSSISQRLVFCFLFKQKTKSTRCVLEGGGVRTLELSIK